MPLPFACPHCGEQTLVDDEFAGQSGPCVNCGRLVIVPRFALTPGGPRIVLQPAWSPRSRWLFLLFVGIAATVAVIALLAVLSQPVLEMTRAASNRRQCSANLRRIRDALSAYEAKYGRYPPAYTEDDEGNRLHSWRVLILPYLGDEEKALYNQYKLSEPWNSTHNTSVAQTMPAVFRSPGDELAQADNETSYFVIVGKQTPFPGVKGISLSEMSDPPQQTILVVEASGMGITWTEPRDLDGPATTFQIGVDIGGCHKRGANVLLGSGEVRFLPDSMDSDVIRAMSTINGNEQLPDY